MCIVSGDAKVSDTQILSFATPDGKRQVMVYSNKMDINFGGFDDVKRPVAMILPFPEGDCEMLDIGEANDLFSRLDGLFDVMSRSYGTSFSAPLGKLEVKRCGSYRYSVVPGLADFSRLGNNVFNLSSNVMGVLKAHYSSGYSFLVCIIDASAKYAPIAYAHRLRRASDGGGELFVPTRHEHSDGRAEGSRTPVNAVICEEKTDWDHAIYIAGNTHAGNASDSSFTIDLRNYFPPVLAALAPAPMPPHEFRKIEITAYHPNVDLVYSVKTPPEIDMESMWSPLEWLTSLFWGNNSDNSMRV